MARLFTNNAASTLAASITGGSGTITVQSGDGSKFPSPSGADYFNVTVAEGATVEIMKCTSRTGDVLTVTRAQEGTSAVAFTTAALVELRLTAAALTGFEGAVPYNVITTKGDLIRGSAANVPERLPIGTEGKDLSIVSGVPEWVWRNSILGSLTNKTGAQLVAGDVVALSSADASAVVTGNNEGGAQTFVVTLDTIANNATGPFAFAGIVPTVKSTGTITKGQYVRKSTTSLAVESTNINADFNTPRVAGTLGIALGDASGGFVSVMWFSGTTLGARGTREIVKIMKTGDEVVNNSTTLQDDNELQWVVRDDGSDRYGFMLAFIKYQGNTAADLKITLSASGGTTFGAFTPIIHVNAALAITEFTGDIPINTTITLGCNGGVQWVMLFGWFANWAGSGDATFKFQWAQATAHASDLHVYFHSHLVLFMS